MDLASKKLPILIIAILIVVLVAQNLLLNPEPGRFVDETTCEIYLIEVGSDTRQYLGDYDPECLDGMDAP